MAGYLKFDALILREVKYKEADRLLTVFSEDDGIITLKAPGALRNKSKLGAATQQLVFSELTALNRSGFTNITEASVKEGFEGLRKDFSAYALGCYFAECIEALLPQETPDKSVLQLALNSLYALSRNLYDPIQIKAVFELRLMCLLGYAPDLERCSVCGKDEPEAPYFGIRSGRLVCGECRNSEYSKTDRLCHDSLSAMRFIVSAPAKQIFSFKISEDSLKRLSLTCEDYIIQQSERSFRTLDYWKKVKI